MDGKDVIKLILCLYGFDSDIQIHKFECKEENRFMYEIFAKNTEIGNSYFDNQSDSLSLAIYNIIKHMNEHNYQMPINEYNYLPTSYAIDDEKRNEHIRHKQEVLDGQKRFENFKNSKEVRDLFIEKDRKEHPDYYQKQTD